MADEVPEEERLGDALRGHGVTIATAESCTGGLVGSRISSVPGASDYYVGGVVSYMNRSKLQFLAVSRESLDRHGPVSGPVAREMAQHVRDEADADWGVSTTGYAGPGGGSSDEPVGTVYVGVAHAGTAEGREPYATVERHQFDGTRHEVRERVARQALASVREEIRAGD